jgi:hypothetical protein
MPPVAADNVAGASLIANKLDDAIRREVRKRPALAMVGAEEKVLEVVAGAADPRVVEAANLRTAGKADLDAGRLEAAERNLRAALERYELGLASIGTVSTVVETLALLGATRIARGDKKEGRALLRRAAVHDPTAEYDGLPPTAAKILTTERRRARRRARSTLTVRTKPPAAWIRVDGVEYPGPTARVRKLAPGVHYIQAGHDDHGLAGQVFTLRRSTRITLELAQALGEPAPSAVEGETLDTLAAHREDALAATSKKRYDPRFDAAARAVASGNRAEYLVLSRVGPAEGSGYTLHTTLYGVAERRAVELPKLALGVDLSSVFVRALELAKVIDTGIVALGEQRRITRKARVQRRRRR